MRSWFLVFLISCFFISISLNAKELDKNQYIEVSLVDVVLETIAQSNNVKVAREKLEQARLKFEDAKNEYFPKLDASYKAGRTRTLPRDDTTSAYYTDRSYKLALTQNLYNGGSNESNIKRLEEKYLSVKNEYKQAISKEVENAIKAYFDVLFNYQSFMVNSENMDKLNEILEIVKTKYESGAASQGDLSSIRANVANAESKLIKIESKFHEALEYYKYTVGEAFEKTFPYEDTFDTEVDNFSKIVKKAIGRNLKIKNIKFEIQAEKFNLLGAKSNFRPKVDLEVSSEMVLNQQTINYPQRNDQMMVTMSYNLYNKGKDKNKLLQIQSSIRELHYKLQEEIRKLKWSLSKLHRSIISIHNASKSKENEVNASIEMVDSYWEGFKLGEQDLQELLQGQRQLNSAQLELINNKKSTVTDYFKLLAASGEILDYFKLNIDSTNFIDFTKSDYKNLLKTPEEISSKKKQKTDINEKKKEKKVKESLKEKEQAMVKNPIKEILDFNQKFKNSDDNNFTIRIYPFKKVYQALDYANANNIANNVYLFDAWDGKVAKTNIAYGIFGTKEIAKKQLQNLQKDSLTFKVVKIKKIRSLEKKFKNEKTIKKIIVAPKPKLKKEEVFTTYTPFKKEFLNAPKGTFTINITSFLSMNEARKLVTKENIYKQSFIFRYGDDIKLFKVMYGVFKTYDEASKALEKLSKIKEQYDPVIENIADKQELYKKYNPKVQKPVIEKKSKDNQIKETKENKSRGTLDKKLEKNTKSIFQEKFLSAPKDYYTLNLATFSVEKSAELFKKDNKKYIDMFAFRFGYDKQYYKVMGGIYKSYAEAKKALKNLPKRILKKNKPRIEKISIKQKLYHKYNDPKNGNKNDSH